MLTHAQQILENRCTTLDLRWGDIRRLPFDDESFDAVVFAHVLEHIAEPVATLSEMVRVLKPGAPLIGSVTRKGLGQVLMSLRWQNRGYTSHQLDSFLQAAGLEAVRSLSRLSSLRQIGPGKGCGGSAEDSGPDQYFGFGNVLNAPFWLRRSRLFNLAVVWIAFLSSLGFTHGIVDSLNLVDCGRFGRGREVLKEQKDQLQVFL